MAISREEMQRWALRMIDEASRESTAVNAVDDLWRATRFFEGDGTLLFGMQTSPTAFADPGAVVEAARQGLLAWFSRLGAEGKLEQQAQLYSIVTGWYSVSEPEFVRQRREAHEANEAKKQAALAHLRQPLDVVAELSPELARALRGLRAGVDDDFFAEHGALLRPTGASGLDCRYFEWTAAEPEWEEVCGADFPPAPFFPFAGADGDYVGVLVASNDHAPVVYASHEEGFFFMAANLEHWSAMCAAAIEGGRKAKARIERARGRTASLDVALLEGGPHFPYGAALTEAAALLAGLRNG